MAKKDKRVRYNTGKRVDMRQGGRVQLAQGKGVRPKKKTTPVNPNRPVYENPMDDPLYDPRKPLGSTLGPSDKPITPTQPVADPVPAPTPIVSAPVPAPTQPVVAPIPAPTQPVFTGTPPASVIDPNVGRPKPPPVFDPNLGQPPKPQPQPTVSPVSPQPTVPQPTVSPQPTVPQPTVSPQATAAAPPGFIPPSGPSTQALVGYWNPTTGETWTANTGGWTPPPGWEIDNRGAYETPDIPPIGQFPSIPGEPEPTREDIEFGRPGGPGGRGGPGRPGQPGIPKVGDKRTGPDGTVYTLTSWGPPPVWTPDTTSPAPTATTTTPEEIPDTGPWTVYDDEGNIISPGYGVGSAKTPSSADLGGRTPEQLQEVRDIIQAAAEGRLPEGAKIPSPADINAAIASDTMQMDPNTLARAFAVLEEGQRIGYDPSTGEAVTGITPEGFDAGRYDAQTVSGQTPIVDPQTGDWSEYGIANMQSQALTKAAEGIDFTDEQKSRPLLERVIGEIDPQSKMNAVKVAGTDLPRVLRAKKQLRRAGLTEEQINLIGNDPSALEDELMDYTEAERGMIAGLPDEALVSTQMNALLEGMESGEIPAFARPAVAAVNQMLAARGLSASTVGRDNLFNAIISSAMPLAQSNAQSIKESVFSQRGIEAQAEQMNAQMAQQRALTNSERVFNLNMAQFSADQQRAMSQSKFLQTTSLTEVGNDQQASIQEAVSMAQLDLATLDSKTKLTAQNAQTWLQRDVSDLNNRQQAEVLTSQMRQQGLLSDQSAFNASQQFNATSENQTNQFMSSMAANMEQFNKTQQNAMTQFNKTQENQAKAMEEQAELDVAKLDAQLATQIDQFNSQQEYAREQFNTQNAQAVEQSNVAWRRQANTVNTAALNAVNQQNAQNAFGLSTQAMSFLWQEMRDQMDYSFKAWDNDQQRKASLMVAALGNEGASYEGKNWQSNLTGMTNIMNTFLSPGGG